MDSMRNIVVPTDFSPLAQAAAARAATLARIDGAAIHLVHALRFPLVVSPSEASVTAAGWEDVRNAAREKLEEARSKAEKTTGQAVTAKLAEAVDAVQAIVAAVEKHGADLVVMGTHGHGGLKHAFLGSVCERALRTVEVAVLAVKEDLAEAEKPITRLLLAVDFSIYSDHAVEVAARLGKRLAASVDVIHAVDLGSYTPYSAPFGVEFEEKIHASAAEALESVGVRLREGGVPVTLHSRRGHPSVVIAEAAKEIGCQLIVMGTRGNSGLSHLLLGSVAERTIRAAPCSVLAVKAHKTDKVDKAAEREGSDTA